MYHRSDRYLPTKLTKPSSASSLSAALSVLGKASTTVTCSCSTAESSARSNSTARTTRPIR
ncbi:hypothetical protein GBA52_020728 [Prunus armeniaca]|nr:hypothetical protein GBA52_020728 [Prunus armeniaca]